MLSKNSNKLLEDIIQIIEDSDNSKMTIFKIRRSILEKQNVDIETMVSKINNYINIYDYKSLKNTLENIFIEPISKNKIMYVIKHMQNKENISKMLKLHNKNKKLRMMRIINQIL